MTETKAAGTGGAGERSRAEQPATTGEETTSAGGIAAKLLAAARAVGNVEKSGRNARHGYDYVTIDDVVRAARTALLAEGSSSTRRSPRSPSARSARRTRAAS